MLQRKGKKERTYGYKDLEEACCYVGEVRRRAYEGGWDDDEACDDAEEVTKGGKDRKVGGMARKVVNLSDLTSMTSGEAARDGAGDVAGDGDGDGAGERRGERRARRIRDGFGGFGRKAPGVGAKARARAESDRRSVRATDINDATVGFGDAASARGAKRSCGARAGGAFGQKGRRERASTHAVDINDVTLGFGDAASARGAKRSCGTRAGGGFGQKERRYRASTHAVDINDATLGFGDAASCGAMTGGATCGGSSRGGAGERRAVDINDAVLGFGRAFDADPRGGESAGADAAVDINDATVSFGDAGSDLGRSSSQYGRKAHGRGARAVDAEDSVSGFTGSFASGAPGAQDATADGDGGQDAERAESAACRLCRGGDHGGEKHDRVRGKGRFAKREPGRKEESDDVKKAVRKMLDLLAKREYTQKELEDRLKGSFTPAAVDGALQYCAERGYQSDLRHAEMLLRHMEFSLYGPHRLYLEGRKRGDDEETLRTLAADTDWDDLAYEALRRKWTGETLQDAAQRRKASAYLMRRGFTAGQCLGAVERLQKEYENR